MADKTYKSTGNPKIIEETTIFKNDIDIESLMKVLEQQKIFIELQSFKVIPDQECLDFWNATHTQTKRIGNVISNAKLKMTKLIQINLEVLIPKTLNDRFLTLKNFY